ncbi:MAG: tRNA (guanosine(46)-N7)-methyltransferase TrmB [Chloroflexi bacterium]|nr:tRNA (guanosine(46)-N7)-methyltransferase TrmB [Chloroflexota bacterium]MDL1885767.1 tRNA (guanosine(46)-N7)-methyltransferase TrmB [Anaerolineae bacterium CFX8]
MRKLSSLTLPWPTDWAALFGVERPLIVEIGFGYGQFLLHLARAHPDASIIGLEIANRCLSHVEAQIERGGFTNARVIHSTAETALHHLFQPASISQIHINFPDPWFKKRHGHRRLMQRDTLDVMVNRLAPGGMLYLATDILEYAEMSAGLLAATPGLDNTLETPWASSLPGRALTRYEGKAARTGRACYYFACRRNYLPPPPVAPVKELDMPHLVIKSALTLDTIYEAFTPGQHQTDGIYISFLYIYRSRNVLLLEVYVKEPTIDQHVAFLLSERAPNEFSLRLSTLGHPRPTPGLHAAAGLLGEWLMSLHPGAEIIKQAVKD